MALSKKKFITIVIATLLLIFLTRGLIITHNIELHCDEIVTKKYFLPLRRV